LAPVAACPVLAATTSSHTTSSNTYRGTSNTSKNTSTHLATTPMLPSHVEAYVTLLATMQPPALETYLINKTCIESISAHPQNHLH